jgi:hypothetical protein
MADDAPPRVQRESMESRDTGTAHGCDYIGDIRVPFDAAAWHV